MIDSKIGAAHRQRLVLVYVRRSPASQAEHNHEATRRQYSLADRARHLGWHPDSMFNPRGNPQARHLFEANRGLQDREGLHLKDQAIR